MLQHMDEEEKLITDEDLISKVIGRHSPIVGEVPAIIMNNPKYPRNLGSAIRAASCFGVNQIWYTGNRIQLDPKDRLPREERMKGYKHVKLINYDYPFDQFPQHTNFVALEFRENSEPLFNFYHPENAVYVFGPEDGSISQAFMRHCHRFVVIPTNYCTNLAAAIYITLYDRQMKRNISYWEP